MTNEERQELIRKENRRHQMNLESLGQNEFTAAIDAAMLEDTERIRLENVIKRQMKSDVELASAYIATKVDDIKSRTGLDWGSAKFKRIVARTFGRYLAGLVHKVEARQSRHPVTLFEGWPDNDREPDDFTSGKF